MICSHIEKDDYIFIQLHAEQSYTNVELYKKYSLDFNNDLLTNETKSDEDKEEGDVKNIDCGVFGRRLTNKTLLKLSLHFISLDIRNKILAIDFAKLILAQKNSFKIFHEILRSLLDNNNTIILKGIGESLFEDLKINSFKRSIKNQSMNDYVLCENVTKIKPEDVSDTKRSSEFERKLLNEVGLSSNSQEELNHSSSIYLNKYINVKKLINNKEFFAYCVYQLAIKMMSEGDDEWYIKKDYGRVSDRITLFFQTLNGACIASLLSDLLHVDICYVDHIGPINNLYNTCFGERIQKDRKYVVVSDVICLGTEVKIAKSLIGYNGGEYLGNVSILRTKILKDEDRKYENIKTLFEVNKKSNRKYSIGYKLTAKLV